MDYARTIDRTRLASTDGARAVQWLLNADSGADRCAVVCIKTLPGEGSPTGVHSHEFQQIDYMLEGVMEVEIDGKQFSAEPGTLIYYPAGVPHRNWNAGATPTLHLTFQVNMPEAR